MPPDENVLPDQLCYQSRLFLTVLVSWIRAVLDHIRVRVPEQTISPPRSTGRTSEAVQKGTRRLKTSAEVVQKAADRMEKVRRCGSCHKIDHNRNLWNFIAIAPIQLLSTFISSYCKYSEYYHCFPRDVPELSRLEEKSPFATREGWATFIVGELGAAGYTLAYIAKDCCFWSEWNDRNFDNWSCAIKALSTLIILSASTYATSGVIAAQFLDDQGNHSKRWLNTTENMTNVYNISMLINTWNSQGINATVRKPLKYVFADEDHNIYKSDIVFSVDEPRGHNILWDSRPDGGTILLGKPAGSSNATLVKKGDWNDQYFIQGGLAMDDCKLNGNSELLNIIYDFDKAYDALNSNPGFWYYEKGCRLFRVKDNNHNAWISMGAIKP
ncbi:hypothetical protein V1508DRAFT_442307 [Lipomyces doorenjongii]|uniref:uncharacterized protein n=1 Tax=Lipomyces doorenjongii TaxID=383834 RepID=UPI0034CE8C57